MAARQTTYPAEQALAVNEGQVSATTLKNCDTGVDEIEALKFGRAVVTNTAGTDKRSVRLPSAGADIFRGMTTFTQFNANQALAGTNEIAQNEEFAMMTVGRMWVKPEVAVSIDDPVFWRHTANGPLTDLGRIRNDNDGGNAKQIPNARFLSASSADEFAEIEITQAETA